VRDIKKSKEPRALRAYRLSEQPPSYEDFRDKDVLRGALLSDQSHICGYCMQRIKLDTMKIEHWSPQAADPAQQLSWKNLLGACPGGQGQPPRLQHCDTRKGNTRITLNPNERVEHKLRYLSNGELRAIDTKPEQQQALQHELEEILNLNLQQLRGGRMAALAAFLEVLKRKRPTGDWSRDFLEKELENLKNRQKLTPYYQYTVYFIEKRLRRAART